MDIFLEETEYADFSAQSIRELSERLFDNLTTDGERIKAAFDFVNTQIPHTADIGGNVLPFRASEVLAAGTGVCFAKSNLLAALLRSVGIKTGFAYQYLTLDDKDDSQGYAIHGLNAVYYGGKWLLMDARGGRSAVFSLERHVIAFPLKKKYGEYFIDGVFARQDSGVVKLFGEISSRTELWRSIPQKITDTPDTYLSFME